MAQSQDGHHQPTVVGKLSPLSPVGPVASEDLMFLVLPFVENPWVTVEVTPVWVVTASTVLGLYVYDLSES